MKLGAISLNVMRFDFEEGLSYLQNLGVQAIEIACGGAFTGRRYCEPEKLISDRGELERWLDAFRRHGLEISALAVH